MSEAKTLAGARQAPLVLAHAAAHAADATPFSVTIRCASTLAARPPRASFRSRKAMTAYDQKLTRRMRSIKLQNELERAVYKNVSAKGSRNSGVSRSLLMQHNSKLRRER